MGACLEQSWEAVRRKEGSGLEFCVLVCVSSACEHESFNENVNTLLSEYVHLCMCVDAGPFISSRRDDFKAQPLTSVNIRNLTSGRNWRAQREDIKCV